MITQHYQGLFDNKELYSFNLKKGSVEINITNLGCIILSIYTADRNGNINNIVAGFKTIDEYKNNKEFFGCIVGRYANRIANGTFTIDGKAYTLALNDGANNLHGGRAGFDKKVWQVEQITDNETESGVMFSYVSIDGEEGFPGNLKVWVTYLLNVDNELIIHYRATTDKATPLSLTNHSYFNLTGFADDSVLNHHLQISSNEYTEKNALNRPTGIFIEVDNTIFDFRTAKQIGKDINAEDLKRDMGYDHNLVLKHRNSNKMLHAATLSESTTGRIVDVFTTAPGMQVYTANFWDGSITGAQNKTYQKHGAVALETQLFPDSPNQPNFPDSILNPGEEYHSTTVYAFRISNE